jgi:hypothetical protein
MHQRQEDNSIYQPHIEEAPSTRNQQIQEEWTRNLEQQQLIHAMLASILEPLPLTMKAHRPSKPLI